jgi:hypothetical protein
MRSCSCDVFELELATFARALILFGLLHVQRPVVVCAVAKGSPVVFLGALVQPSSLQSLCDEIYARLRDARVVFDVFVKLLVLDEVFKLVAHIDAARLAHIVVRLIVGKDVVDAAVACALFVATL